ncbi:uncharacterized protein JN550_001199 [Neoarthrinium moseri]|uniref:uncharacterized protein n=1 Tax=Neoarthrinium moseri TaxID=1658444 RepID=UPI001FDDCA95|nr:uncharacterized protein JN550_001199 [Neoarthrinium moseri]KAI1877127.1 hypothetical protein JN550_001199 [Neoarthrinium moseri]
MAFDPSTPFAPASEFDYYRQLNFGTTLPYRRENGRHSITSRLAHPIRVAGSDPWSYSKALQIALEPRSFNELNGQRECLLEALNLESERVLKLFREWATFDDMVQLSEGIRLREIKKSRSWCRKQIAESIEEEKAILLRLSDIHIEIQSRERWCTVWKERSEPGIEYLRQTWHHGNGGRRYEGHHATHSPLTLRPHTWQPAMSLPLGLISSNGSAPGCEEDAFTRGQYQKQHSPDYQQDAVALTANPMVTVAMGSNPAALHDKSKTNKFQYFISKASESSPSDISTIQPTRKRNSMPELMYVWTDESVGEEGHKCLGYAGGEKNRLSGA